MNRSIKITTDNKSYIVRRYTDYAVSRMDNIEIFNNFKDYRMSQYRGCIRHVLSPKDFRLCSTTYTDLFARCGEIISCHLTF